MQLLFPQFIIIFVFLLCSITACQSPISPTCTYKDKPVDFLPTLTCFSDFSVMSGKPLSEKYGSVSAVKIVYRIRDEHLYFVSSKSYPYHFDFCSRYLGAYVNMLGFNENEYSDSPQRQFVLANLNHYTASDRYVLEFFADDKVPTSLLLTLFKKVQRSVFCGDKMSVLLNSENIAQRTQSLKNSIPLLPVDSIYAGQTYQALHKASAYGYLRKLDVKKIGKTPLTSRDIVLTNGLPNDFPVVAGIITSCFQTPLCHVNLLSANRGTPNAALKTAWDDPRLAALDGQLVYYDVLADSLLIRRADEKKALDFWKEKSDKQTKVNLSCDTGLRTIADLSKMRYSDAARIGGKAANFAELMRVRFPDKPDKHLLGEKITSPTAKKLPLPEGAFAIPVFFYRQHIEQNHLQYLVDAVIANAQDPIFLKKSLKQLRDTIKHCPVNPTLLKMVKQQIQKNNLPYSEYRFRSSTNAEDVAGFNGAGLYDSYTGSLNNPQKSIEKAIQRVWASLWNERAFVEREAFGIVQKEVAMAILVHRAFGTEAANGVAITKHWYRREYPAYTINVQKGEISVVLPTDSIRCEQIIVNISSFLATQKKEAEYAPEYIHSSSLLPNGHVLTTEETEQLCRALDAIKEHFYYQTKYNETANNYFDFAMDVEFKLDSTSRKLYIKQARPF